MTEEPASLQGSSAISETPSPFYGEGTLQLGHSQQVIHFKSAQSPTEVNLDAATMDSPSVEDHEMPSRSSHLIP